MSIAWFPRSAVLFLGTVVSILACTAVVRAQAAAPPAAGPTTRAAMEELAWLAGRWEGEAWYQTRSGERQTIVQTEEVELRLDGLVLLVEGIGREKRADGSLGPIVHHALAAVSYDPDRERYTFRAFKDGRSIDTETSLEESGFTWSYETPAVGTFRYRIRQDQGSWHETGEYSRDGATWHLFFEMRLQRSGRAGRGPSAETGR